MKLRFMHKGWWELLPPRPRHMRNSRGQSVLRRAWYFTTRRAALRFASRWGFKVVEVVR